MIKSMYFLGQRARNTENKCNFAGCTLTLYILKTNKSISQQNR